MMTAPNLDALGNLVIAYEDNIDYELGESLIWEDIMLNLRFVVWMFSIGVMIMGAGSVSGQDYPNKPIRIVTAAAGGSLDLTSRLIAPGISGPLGQQVIVDNRPALIAIEAVAKAPPDGYTLLVAGTPLWIGPLLRKLSYDPVRDFLPITMVGRSPGVVVVHPSLPVTSVKELIALAKARPGELNYASASPGSSTHLAPELFKAMAGVNIVSINYKGTAAAINDLSAGEVQLMIAPSGAVEPLVKSGRLKALAVTSAQPSALVPGLPTVAASGLPGYESVAMFSVFAPAGTSAAIINRLNQEIVRSLNMADVKEKFFNVRIETVGSSPEQFAVTMKVEMDRMGNVIKSAGIKLD